MASFRRSLSVVHRDGAAQNGEARSHSDTPPSPKSSHARPYLALDLLMVLQRARAAFPCVFRQRSSRPGERSKLRGLLHWKGAFFYLVVCFLIGIFVGFMPFLAVDTSKDFVSKHQAFSFKKYQSSGNAHQNFDLVGKEALVLEKQPYREDNLSLGTVGKGKMRDEVLDTSFAQSPIQDSELVPRKLLLIVTPTYARPFQAYYLNRLVHTLRVIPPPLLWIVVEMSLQSAETAKILRESGVMYRHLVCDKNVTGVKDRRVHQRNVALAHIEKHHLDGIVLFADDDRVYSADLFEQMRQIRRFGTWPVAILMESKNKVLVEGPVCNGTQVIGWHTYQRRKKSRRFHVDISGFAFNSTILWDPKRWPRPTSEPIRQRDTVQHGFQETTFVEQLVEDERQMEGLPNNCSRIMVWHLHLEIPDLVYPTGWLMQKNLEVVGRLT